MLREIIKDQEALGRNSIAVSALLARLGLDATLREARERMREALQQIESPEVWALLGQVDERRLRVLIGGVALAEMQVSSFVEDDF